MKIIITENETNRMTKFLAAHIDQYFGELSQKEHDRGYGEMAIIIYDQKGTPLMGYLPGSGILNVSDLIVIRPIKVMFGINSDYVIRTLLADWAKTKLGLDVHVVKIVGG